MKYDVFISYSSKNPEVAQAICHTLEEHGIRCWMAPRNIPIGRDYGDMIDEAIVRCKVFLFVYSCDSLNSVWCKGELNVAFSENKIIIPYRIDTTPMRGAVRVMLNQFHWLDAYPDYRSQFARLVDTVSGAVGEVPSNPNILNDNRFNITSNTNELSKIISAIKLTKQTFSSIIRIEKCKQISNIGIAVIGKVVYGRVNHYSKFLLYSSGGEYEYSKTLNFNNISEMLMYSQCVYDSFNKRDHPLGITDFYLKIYSINCEKAGNSLKADRGNYVGLLLYNRSNNNTKYIVENSSYIYCI